jgi:hypothetical protein
MILGSSSASKNKSSKRFPILSVSFLPFNVQFLLKHPLNFREHSFPNVQNDWFSPGFA